MKNHEGSIVKCNSVLYRYGQSYISKRLEFLNIGSGQYVFLMTLFRTGGISQEELSKYLRIDKGTTAKAIKKLEEAGYVIREIDLRDKRAYKVYLTPKAVEVISTIQAAAKEWENIITSGLSEEEKQWVEKILLKMSENGYNFKFEDEEINE
ncbi:transcriptional regulator [Desulfosporosinus orientis DSM 765]|uniref:Transcriptional regulator n=1 Tax=Desulfosporosinus orientis (strain ATCC 19365 / DSM 765 / NCIMB 8382 / VKM B-1628 / Singapore I) TaxID=768706 RepID=G7W571_DESOD|nr:MarR family transcriptional regulator [Desulfosporosinus orientis]AET66087.1 transcriptional regulator [Desulfosporosinus orientis DSM 765]